MPDWQRLSVLPAGLIQKSERSFARLLGRMAAQISVDWQQTYRHPMYFLETFVDPERFRGTRYQAAHWVVRAKTADAASNPTGFGISTDHAFREALASASDTLRIWNKGGRSREDAVRKQ